MKKKLYKSEKYKMICGVCGGIAEYFNCDPTLIRLIAVILGLFKGAGLLLYVVAAIIVPSANMKGASGYSNGEDISDEDLSKMKSAKVSDADKENTSESDTSRYNGESPRSDEEFNSYFKKGKK